MIQGRQYLTLLACCLLITTAAAQSFLTNRQPERLLQVEFLHPNPEGFDISTLSGIWFYDARLKINDRTNLIMEVPYARIRFEEGRFIDESFTESSLGNPYVGIEFASKKKSIRYEVGVRLPFISNNLDETANVLVLAAFSDIDRLEAFIPEQTAISWLIHIFDPDRKKMFVRAVIGPQLLLNHNDAAAESYELLLNYGITIGTRNPNSFLSAGISGKYLATENGSVADRSLTILGAAFSARAGKVWPGIQFRLPLDNDLSRIIDSAVSFTSGLDL